MPFLNPTIYRSNFNISFYFHVFHAKQNRLTKFLCRNCTMVGFSVQLRPPNSGNHKSSGNHFPVYFGQVGCTRPASRPATRAPTIAVENRAVLEKWASPRSALICGMALYLEKSDVSCELFVKTIFVFKIANLGFCKSDFLFGLRLRYYNFKTIEFFYIS